MDTESFRNTMPVFDDTAYLNTGASSPGSKPVIQSMEDFLEWHGYAAPTDEGMYPPVFETLDETRAVVADFVNAEPNEIALTQSTGDGISRVAGSLSWEAGNTVVRSDTEHPAGVIPWESLGESRGVNISVLQTDDGKVALDDVKEIVSDTKLVCLSSISWNYGTKLPVREITEIAHDAGAEVLVDAVQSVGQTPVDVTEWGVDYVAGAGHKWVGGPWGAGFLYVAPDAATNLQPDRVSYRSVDPDAEEFTLYPDARRLELGTTSAAPYAGLQTALNMINEIGVSHIEIKIEQLTQELKSALPDEKLLSPRSFESGLVTIDDEAPDETVEQLAAKGVQIRSIPSPNAIRASVHGYNNKSDIQAFVSALEETTT